MIRVYRKWEFGRILAEGDFDPGAVAGEDASAHLVLTEDGRTAARCSVWWEGTPPHPDGVCGTIGQFWAEDAGTASLLLEAACALLREEGCRSVLAPMHGNTYRSYRYAVEGMDRLPFLMEPPAAGGRDRFLEAGGFGVVNRYHSYLKELGEGDVSGQHARLEEQGIRIETLDMDRLEETLALVYRLSCVCFRDNDHYTDIPEEAFVAQYLAYRQLIVPEFVLLAYRGEECVGFTFCIPDYLEGPQPSTVLLKTIGVLPECRRLGLGNALLDTVRAAAWKRGFRQAIGALVHEENVSRRLVDNRTILRRYALYGKTL